MRISIVYKKHASFIDKLSHMNESNDFVLNSFLGASGVEYHPEEVCKTRLEGRSQFFIDSDGSNAKFSQQTT